MADDGPRLVSRRPMVGLILTGGGARAAYQVGVLQAIAELMGGDGPTPFPIISGTSAGAINAATLASEAGNFGYGVNKLVDVWSHFQVNQVFRADPHLALGRGIGWLLTFLSGGLGRLTPRSILDNSPLRALLDEQLRPHCIQHWVDREVLHGFSITAASYFGGQSVTFYQGHPDIKPWARTRRIGIPRPITLNHLMASVAIPIIFPAVRIGYDYYGDGSMRQSAPLSAALHLGADRLLVIGVRQEHTEEPEVEHHRIDYPAVGDISGYILDTLFMDALSMDVERLKRINNTLGHIPEDRRHGTRLRQIQLLTIFPSHDVGEIAQRHARALPRSVRYLLRSLGSTQGRGKPLVSYLLFEEGFCRELIDLGYRDAMRLRHRIRRLVDGETAEVAEPGAGVPRETSSGFGFT